MSVDLDHGAMTSPSDKSRVDAMRAAFAATRQLKGHPASGVRDTLHAELTARGITNLEPADLDPMVDAVLRGPGRAVLTGAWSLLVEFRGLLRENRDEPLLSWIASPRRAHKLEWGNRSAVRAVVELAPDDPTVIDRIFDDVPDLFADDEDRKGGGYRLFPCWVDVGPLDEVAGTVSVHAGT